MKPVKRTTRGRRTLRCPCRGALRRRRSTTITNPAPYVTPIVPRHPPCGRTRRSRETTGPRSPRERRHAAAFWVAHSAGGSTGRRGEPATQSRHAVRRVADRDGQRQRTERADGDRPRNGNDHLEAPFAGRLAGARAERVFG